MKQVTIVGSILLAATIAAAQTTAPATQPTDDLHNAYLTLHPAAAPVPALKYELLPRYDQQTPGNAAPQYFTAFLLLHLDADANKKLDGFFDVPAGKFPVADAKAFLANYRAVLDQLDLAGRRDHCDWEIPLREGGFMTLLPQLTSCRNAARLLSILARVQISEGQYDQAIHTLQTGFAMVAHLKSDAVLVQGLVALAIEDLLMSRLVELEQTAGAPNLYWALTYLPEHFVDLRELMQTERQFPFWAIPTMKDHDPEDFTDQEIQQSVRRIFRIPAAFNGQTDAIVDAKMVADVALSVGPARQWLLAHGYAEEKLKDVSPMNMVTIYFIRNYRVVSDDIYKWVTLPYWQRRIGIQAAQDVLRDDRVKGDLNPLMQLLPAISKVSTSVAKTERRMAMLRVVEAIRAYAAGHDGKLPAALADITDMPIPQDSITGRPFDYETAGNTATLKSDGGKEHPEDTQVFHIRIQN